MKKILSMLLATVFMLTAFGVATVFSGFISAGALYDYYIYEQLPGYTIFTDEELARMTNLFTDPGYNEVIDGVPVVTYKFSKGNEWRHVSIYNGQGRNLKSTSNTLHNDFTDMTWASIDTVGFKTFLGDIRSPDYKTLEDQDGLAFRVFVNGQPYTGSLGITLMQYPTTGPYFTMTLDDNTGDHTAEELADYGIGFRYSSKSVNGDAEGYFHFDFKTDFRQSDWWSTTDDGENLWKTYHDNGKEIPYLPLPEKVIPKVSGINLSIGGLSTGDLVSIGDMMAYHDSRVHTDELDELMAQYDDLDPEAYTESSYETATDVYLEAFEIMSDDDIGAHYTQKQINTVAKNLKAALKALQPMFKVEKTDVKLAGFEVWDEDDFDEMIEGGICLDTPAPEEDNVPANKDQSVLVFANAVDGPPTYGWSLFTNATEDGAVKNPFELEEGSEPLSESSGLRFWVKWDESLAPVPQACRIGLGVSSEELYFECEETAVDLPESEGYIGVAWNTFYDFDGDAEIFDYLDEVDTIYIYLEGVSGIYYIADLSTFEWSINSADFSAMDQQIIDSQNYLASLNKDDYSVRSWQRVEQSIEAARALHDEYAVTQQDVNKATEFIVRCLNWLTKRGDTPTQEEIDALEAAYYSALSYWHGNYTGRSYVALKAEIDEVSVYINDELSSTACVELTDRLNTAIAGLVPITHGGTVAPTPATDYNGNPVSVKLFSLEDFSGNREFNKAIGHRVANVGYDLVTSSTSVTLPAKALKMTAQADLSSKHTDQHGAMQFKLADKICDPIHPDVTTADGNQIGGSIGDLKGSAGIRIWVGVNDSRLARNAYFRFGVSNCQEGPLFEKHAVNIPFPASGSGWLYIPWESFDYYDDWTGGQDINLTEIRFIIIRVDGEVPQGLEVYATCVSAYTDQANSTNVKPTISGVSDGQTIDVAGGSVTPKWDIGTATLKVDNDAKYYVAGTPITENGTYTLTVTNGDKQTSATFTVTGGTVADATPIVAGVTDGGVYNKAVTITWDVGEATLNGEPFEKGGSVSEAGFYVLEVVNGTKTTSVRFEIKGSAVRKGDPDGDGEISVSDALIALRIAARLAQSTDELLQTCDVDADGEITVNDALMILRVAARLADETSFK